MTNHTLRRTFRLSALLLLAANVASAQMPPAPVILTEDGFEGVPAYIPDWGAGYQGVYKPATGWKEPFTVKLDREDPHSGLACMRVEFNGAGEDLIRIHSKGIPVPEALRGKNIRVEAYVRSEGIASGSIGLGILQKDAGGKTLGYLGLNEKLAPVAAGNEWQKITAQGKLNSNAASLILMLTADATTGPGQLWVDDVIVLSAD
ncbi:hypothetical protein H5P28_13730 [Ruficoccus amylovorans]|uniref:Uncharacterized protein n=1 Tax=Ruficoccus amylovorans TaxID=1804625 RepID=A0A842HFM3_9BACT|nr:hypothetical protein [Ruficoccus amylovorans]MBC2595323.1 hypothetical protein [Ruficoccus amylovorans]